MMPTRSGLDPEASLRDAKRSGATILLLHGLDEKNVDRARALAREWKERTEKIAVVVELADPELKNRLSGEDFDLLLQSTSPILASLEPLAARLGVGP
jgi:hypothetical protein